MKQCYDSFHDTNKNLIEKFNMSSQKSESTKWDKLPSSLWKVVLYVSSHAYEKWTPSSNYFELLQCNNSKSALLLIHAIAANTNRDIYLQPDLINNLLKGFWYA